MEHNITYGAIVGNASLVTLVEAKSNSHIESSDEDTILQLFLDGAVEDAENYVGMPLLKKDVLIGLSAWPDSFALPIIAVSNFSSITYRDINGAEQTLDQSNYRYDEASRTLIMKSDSLPELEEGNRFPISISCVAGYDSETVPKFLKSAVLLRFGHREMFREDVPTGYNRTFENALKDLKYGN